jgi:hypothetical protein
MVECRGLRSSCPRERDPDGRKLAIVPNQSQRLYLFGTTGIFSSNDAGATWQQARMPGSMQLRQVTSPKLPQAHSLSTFPSQNTESGWSAPMARRLTSCCRHRCRSSQGFIRRTFSAVIAGGDQSRNLVAAFGQQYLGFSTNFGGQWARASVGPPAGLQIHALARAVTGSRTVYAATSAGHLSARRTTAIIG